MFFCFKWLNVAVFFLSAAYQVLYNNDMYVCFQVLNKSVEIVVSTPRCLTRRRPVGHWRIWGQKSPSEFFKLGGSDVDGVLHTAPHDPTACSQPRCTQLREPQPPPSLLFVGICEIISAQIRPPSDVRPLRGEHRRKRPVVTFRSSWVLNWVLLLPRTLLSSNVCAIAEKWAMHATLRTHEPNWVRKHKRKASLSCDAVAPSLLRSLRYTYVVVMNEWLIYMLIYCSSFL